MKWSSCTVVGVLQVDENISITRFKSRFTLLSHVVVRVFLSMSGVLKINFQMETLELARAGADPELLLGGGGNPWGGCLPNILVIFSEKPYEIKEFLVRRGGRPGCGPP